MGHPIHKHMSSGIKSAERYDAKEAYDKDLSSKARMHYLENDIADHKGSPAHMEGGRKNHKMSNSEYAAHLESPRGKKEHGAGMSRQASPLNIDGGKAKHEKHIGRKLDDETWGGHTQTEKHHRGPSRKGSPARMDASYDDAPMEFNKGLKKAQRQGKLSGEFNTLVKNSSVSRKASPVNNINYGTGYIGDKSKISYNENHVPQREMAAGKKSPNSRKKYY